MARPMQQYDNEPKEFSEKVVQVNRVNKKTKGGNQVGFSTLVVVGNRKGKVGVALGKAPDVLSSIKKGVRKAKKRMIDIPLDKNTIPFPIESKYGAAKVLLKPAPPGSGIIAGGAVRAVVEAAGVSDIVGKILGSNNQASNVYATFEALDQIRKLVKVKGISLKKAVQPGDSKANGQAKAKVIDKKTEAPKKVIAAKKTAKKPVRSKVPVKK